jgi:hypothetical protein
MLSRQQVKWRGSSFKPVFENEDHLSTTRPYTHKRDAAFRPITDIGNKPEHRQMPLLSKASEFAHADRRPPMLG